MHTVTLKPIPPPHSLPTRFDKTTMPASKSVKLNTGAEMPTVGLGTWKSKPGEVEHAVEHALKYGYKHIDTAAAYDNETEVGKGIKMSGVPREEIFLTTKLNNPDQRNAEQALLDSLKKLDTPYIDLCKHEYLHIRKACNFKRFLVKGLCTGPLP